MGRDKEALWDVEDTFLVLGAPKQVAGLTNQDREEWRGVGGGDSVPRLPSWPRGERGWGQLIGH